VLSDIRYNGSFRLNPNTNALILATCYGFYKTIFRTVVTAERYIQCVHTLWDPIVFT